MYYEESLLLLIMKNISCKKTDSNTLGNAILVTLDAIGWYSSTPHVTGLKILKNVLDTGEPKSIQTFSFVLKNKFLNLMRQLRRSIGCRDRN